MHTPEQKRAYRLAHKEEIAAYNREYHKKHYEKNREAAIARAGAWAKANPEKMAAHSIKWRLANPEKARTALLEWRRANPEKVAVQKHRRRARVLGGGGSHTAEQRIAKFEELGNRCFYCGIGGKLTLDHQTPLSRGGTNNLDNIVPCCGSCNSRKGTKTLDEFLDHFEVRA